MSAGNNMFFPWRELLTDRSILITIREPFHSWFCSSACMIWYIWHFLDTFWVVEGQGFDIECSPDDNQKSILTCPFLINRSERYSMDAFLLLIAYTMNQMIVSNTLNFRQLKKGYYISYGTSKCKQLVRTFNNKICIKFYVKCQWIYFELETNFGQMIEISEIFSWNNTWFNVLDLQKDISKLQWIQNDGGRESRYLNESQKLSKKLSSVWGFNVTSVTR